MTDYKRITRCVKNCIKTGEAYPEHTNQDCHLKKICCCYDLNDKKEEKNRDESKVCKICCCAEQKRTGTSSSPRQKCICSFCIKKESLECEICKVCFCLMKECICKGKKAKKSSRPTRPRKLCEDLPLYDEKSHLLGYIKKGAIIDEPFCVRSRDKLLENTSSSGPEGWPRILNVVCEEPRMCMASCRYAEGVKGDSGEMSLNVPRWTTKSAFEHATGSPITQPRQTSPTNRKLRKKTCACGK